jgi:hypothetical protein
VAFVFFGEAIDKIILMLPDPVMQVVRHSDVQNAGYARDHVHEVGMLFHASTIIYSHLSFRPSMGIRFANPYARGGTCFCLLLAQANSRSLDCDDHSLADDLLRSG